MSPLGLLISAIGLCTMAICAGTLLTQNSDLKTVILGGRLVVVGIVGIVAAFALFAVWRVNP